MFLQYSIYPHRTVHVPTEQFMSSEHSLWSGVQFMSQECSLRPHSAVYVPREQFMSLDCNSFPMTTSLCPYGSVYVP